MKIFHSYVSLPQGKSTCFIERSPHVAMENSSRDLPQRLRLSAASAGCQYLKALFGTSIETRETVGKCMEKSWCPIDFWSCRNCCWHGNNLDICWFDFRQWDYVLRFFLDSGYRCFMLFGEQVWRNLANRKWIPAGFKVSITSPGLCERYLIDTLTYMAYAHP